MSEEATDKSRWVIDVIEEVENDSVRHFRSDSEILEGTLEVAYRAAEKARKEERERLEAVIEADRATAAGALNAIKNAIKGHEWLRLGRGSYEYNDSRWMNEFADAITQIEFALDPLKRLAGDTSDSPKTWSEIERARLAQRNTFTKDPPDWRDVPLSMFTASDLIDLEMSKQNGEGLFPCIKRLAEEKISGR